MEIAVRRIASRMVPAGTLRGRMARDAGAIDGGREGGAPVEECPPETASRVGGGVNEGGVGGLLGDTEEEDTRELAKAACQEGLTGEEAEGASLVEGPGLGR